MDAYDKDTYKSLPLKIIQVSFAKEPYKRDKDTYKSLPLSLSLCHGRPRNVMYMDTTWDFTYITWAEYSVCAHELSIRASDHEQSIRVTNCAYDITWDITYITWAE